MRNITLFASILVGGLLTGCASAPITPSVKMQSLNSYVNMEDCASIRKELATVSSWEKYYEDDSNYHKSNAVFSNVMTGVGAVLSVAGSYYGDSNSAQEAASVAQTTAVDGAASRENADASAKEQSYIIERRRTLEKMSMAYQCEPA